MQSTRAARTTLSLFALVALVAPLAFAQGTPAGGSEAEAKVDQANYEIGVNDLLEIFVWDEETQSRKVRVRPDGMITLPLVDDIEAAGRTPLELRREIEARLVQFVKTPTVTVIVEEIDSRFVYVLGEVGSQGFVSLNQPLGLLEVIAIRSGLSDFARGKVTILRVKAGEEQRIEVDLEPLFDGDPEAENVEVRPGDVILVR